MFSKIVLIVVYVVGHVRSDVFYSEPVAGGFYQLQPAGYYKHPAALQPYKGYARSWIPQGAYAVQGDDSRKYYDAETIQGERYSGDLLRKNVHEAQDIGLETAKGATGKHAVSVNTAGSQGYLGSSSGRGTQGAGGVSREGVKEFGASGTEGYGAFGTNGYRKGHSSSGFHKSYQNVESGNNSKFVDEDLKQGGEISSKAFGDMFGQAGKHAYGETVNGGGHDHVAVSRDSARSGLDSAGLHDVSYGEHGHRGSYSSQDGIAAAEQQGDFHDSLQATGEDYGRIHQNRHYTTDIHKPYFIPYTINH